MSDRRADTSRRRVLKLAGHTALAVLGAPILGTPAFAGSAPRTRTLSLYCVHTGERLTAEYFDAGHYQPDALLAIDRLLRDHRTSDVHTIDPRLLDIVHAVSRTLATRAPLHVLSGYRCKATNEWKRRATSGVAEHSYHISGQALDFFLPGRSLRDVGRVALGVAAGGVGYYPRSGFVHLDSGPFRTWGGSHRS